MSIHKNILPSILDNDLYKFTMQQAVIQLFSNAKVKYQFINRGKHEFPNHFASTLRLAIQEMENLKLTSKEKKFLKNNCPYLSPAYLDFLEGYRYNPEEVTVEQEGNNLKVTIEGYWYRTILWEVPIMALICELYYKTTCQTRQNNQQIIKTIEDKIEKYKNLNISFADFGTRRRHSYEVHDLVIKTLSEKSHNTFIGSSNVHLAMKYNTKPIGTHAHEWFMFHAAKYGYKMANALGLENWVKVYKGDLGIALTDTYGTDIFLQQFDKKLSKLFDGVRHDSGDPIDFAEKIINHYLNMGINPLTKTIIFSDGLNYEKVKNISMHCTGKIDFSFGIGTNLTNDVGLKPMNIVLKLSEAKPENSNWTGVVKLSDEPNKHTGTSENIELAIKSINTNLL